MIKHFWPVLYDQYGHSSSAKTQLELIAMIAKHTITAATVSFVDLNTVLPPFFDIVDGFRLAYAPNRTATSCQEQDRHILGCYAFVIKGIVN